MPWRREDLVDIWSDTLHVLSSAWDQMQGSSGAARSRRLQFMSRRHEIFFSLLDVSLRWSPNWLLAPLPAP